MTSISVSHPKLDELDFIKSLKSKDFEFKDSDKKHFDFDDINVKTKILLLAFFTNDKLYENFLHSKVIEDLNYLGHEELIEKIYELPLKKLLGLGIIDKTEYFVRLIIKNKNRIFFKNDQNFFNFLKTCDDMFMTKNSDIGFSFLHLLVRYSSIKNIYNIVEKVILEYQSEIDIDQVDPKSGYTLLGYACEYSNTFSSIDIVKLILSHPKIIINAKNKGMSSLTLACKYSNLSSSVETIKLLLENENINVNIKDYKGMTALDHINANEEYLSSTEAKEVLLSHPKLKITVTPYGTLDSELDSEDDFY